MVGWPNLVVGRVGQLKRPAAQARRPAPRSQFSQEWLRPQVLMYVNAARRGILLNRFNEPFQ
jgi:hypothetical protein